jgi:hypothetical protein
MPIQKGSYTMENVVTQKKKKIPMTQKIKNCANHFEKGHAHSCKHFEK